MGILLKYKFHLLLILLVSVLYFGLRLPNLTLQPVFADEAIYIRWAQVMRAEPTLRFLPVSDGKTPLFMWIMMPMFKIFEDPLYAGRFLSVVAGFGTLLGVLVLGWRWFSFRVGILASFLIAITPFMVFFDRMALVDSMLAAFSVWSLNLSLLLVKYPRLDLAMFLGYFLGGGLLTKPPGLYSILTLPTTLILLNLRDHHLVKKVIKLFGLWMVAIIIAFVIYNVLRLGPGFSTMSSRNQDYIFTLAELKGRPLDPFIPHIRDLYQFLSKLETWPIFILGIISSILVFIKRDKMAMVILGWGLLPLLLEMVFFKTFTARYILFFIPPLLFITAWGINEVGSKFKMYNVQFIIWLLLILISPWALYLDHQLLTKPEEADLPRIERRGYFEDWTSGDGLKEIASYLIERSKEGSVIVGTEGYFGTLPDGLQIYLDKHSHTAPKENRVAVVGGKIEVLDQLREATKDNQVYLITNRPTNIPVPAGLEKIMEFIKTPSPEIPEQAMTLYKVLPTR